MALQNFWMNMLAHLGVGIEPARACRKPDYRGDPLAHPQIAAMTQREIGDLPPDQLRARAR